MISEYVKLPLLFFSFWFFDAPKEILQFFGSLNHTFLQFFSIPLMLRTFFQPVKNEYRKGLVGFSIGMGIFFKTVLLCIGLSFFLPLLLVEFILFTFFLSFPILTFAVLFL